MANKNRAFSLIEVLLVLVVFGLLSFSVVRFGGAFIVKNRAEVYMNNLMVGLKFARSAAIGLGKPVKFCGSQDYRQCDGDWDKGQIVLTQNQKVLRTFPAIPKGDRLVWRGSCSGAKDIIVFTSMGLPSGRRGHFCYCPSSDPKGVISVILEVTGRLRTEFGPCIR